MSDAISWLDQLQPASWRGVPFAVEGSETRRGRRTAVHEYPYRSEVWVEDLGRGVRAYSLYGFVVGDDCYRQEAAMLAACEQPGPGTLVHPTLGALTVALVGPVTTEHRLERGRAVGLRFEFIETATATFPSAGIATQAAVGVAASAVSGAVKGDFLSSIGNALSSGLSVVDAGVGLAQTFGQRALTLVGDASLVSSAVAGLTGNHGRYRLGNRTSLLNGVSSVQAAISRVTQARVGVGSAAALIRSLAGSL